MPEVKPIFKDPELQRHFEENGFVHLQLLSQETVSKLRELYQNSHPEAPKGFESTTYAGDFEYKKKVSDAVSELIRPAILEKLQNVRVLGSSFLAKPKGAYGEMPMHQDWTIVDEQKYVAVNIWTPLVDCTEKNGTLEVLKGSHRYLYNLRMPTRKFILDGHQEELKPQFTPIPTKAGEAVILNQALVHYSKPSQVDEIRSAVTTGVVSADAPLKFYFWDQEKPGKLERFAQKDDFLLRFSDFHKDIFQRPKLGTSEGFEAFSPENYTIEQVMNEIATAHGGQLPGPVKPKSTETQKVEKGGWFSRILQKLRK